MAVAKVAAGAEPRRRPPVSALLMEGIARLPTNLRRFKQLDWWRQRAAEAESSVYALYLAYRDPRVPWYARMMVAAVVAYALSPIDLIPDFVPVLGYLDDVVLIPLGAAIAWRMIPQDVMAECRLAAQELIRDRPPVSRLGAVMVVILWILLGSLTVILLRR